MDTKFDTLPASLLGQYWKQIQSHEQAGTIVTAIAVVALTFVLYNVRLMEEWTGK